MKWLKCKWVYIVWGVMWLSIAVANRLGANEWLMGYDNVMPELNLELNVGRDRTIYQDYRGVGVAYSVTDAAELTRLPFVWLVMNVFGAHQVRWAWTMVMLLVGGWGAIAIGEQLLNKLSIMKEERGEGIGVKILALCLGLTYVFNPATLQNFYSPLESFSSWFGFLPWIIYFFDRFLDAKKRVGLAGIALLVVAWLASSAFYIQTLFIVLMMILAVMGMMSGKWKRLAAGLGIVIAANAWWFLPLLANMLGADKDVFISQQNLISTPEVQELGKNYGNLSSVATLHGYWFGQINYDIWQTFPQFYLGEWQTQLNSWWAVGWGWVIFVGGIGGYIWQIITNKKNRGTMVGCVLVMMMSMMMMTNGRGIMGAGFAFLSKIDIFAQIFRVAFTKWAFVAALFYGIGWILLWAKIGEITKHGRQKLSRKILMMMPMVMVLAMSGIIYYPIWQKWLFAPQVRVELPDSYFAARDFLAAQDTDARLMYLPSSNMWGWFYYDWGYRGSGFIWQMMPQSVMDRNFDVWSLENEEFTRQLNYALERRDGEILRELAAQYKTRYVLLDYSLLLQTGKNNNFADIDAIAYFLEQSGAMRIWSQDQLVVYDFGEIAPTQVNPNQFPFAYLTDNEWEDNLAEEREIELKAQMEITDEAELKLPVLEEGSRYRAEVALTYEPGKLVVNFYPQIWLRVNQKAQRFISLPEKIELPITTEGSGILVIVDERAQNATNPFEKQQTVMEGKTVNMALDLTVGQHIELLVANADNLYHDENGGLIIDGEQLEPLMMRSENIWGGVSEQQTALLYPTNEVELVVEPLWQKIDLEENVVGCDSLKRGDNYIYPRQESLFYESYNFGAGCSTYLLPTTNGENDYLLSVDAKNWEGRAFKIYVHDFTAAQNPVLERLLDTEELHHQFFLPATARLDIKNENRPLQFMIENRSFGLAAKNELYKISAAQLPLRLLATTELVTSEEIEVKEEKKNGVTQGLFYLGWVMMGLSAIGLGFGQWKKKN